MTAAFWLRMIKAPRPQRVELIEWQIAERERWLRELAADA
jgi:hypothetical protein